MSITDSGKSGETSSEKKIHYFRTCWAWGTRKIPKWSMPRASNASNIDHHCVPDAGYSYIHLQKLRDKYLGFISLEVMMWDNGKEGTNMKDPTREETIRLISAWFWRSTPKSQAYVPG